MKIIVFDRTRHENFEKCPRLRLITHEYPTHVEDINTGGNAVIYAVHGVDRRALAVPLLTGGTVHRGIEAFVGGQQENEAVTIALQVYDADIIQRGIEPDENSPTDMWTIKVQRLLCEVLIRGWIRYVWPQLQVEYDVVDIEQEETLDIPVDEETIIRLLTRSDLIMRRKTDGSHFVFNHKTINEPSDRKLQALRYDTQTISEVLAAQARYDTQGRMPEDGSVPQLSPGHIQIDGVIYDLLIKGPKKAEYPKGSGVWHNASPLVWVYVKEGQTGITADELAAKWDWTCTAPHKMYRGECPGGAKHTLGPKYHRKLITEVFETSPVLAWFNWLEENEPGFIQTQFNTLPAIMRTPWDVEVWKRSVLTEEWQIAVRADEARESINISGFHDAEPLLDMLFPKHTAHGNCFWPGKCTAFDICWGSPADDLLQIEGNDGEPLYMPRKSNHPEAIVPDAGE